MTWPHPLTHPSTQPPTYPHPPMGGSVSKNHKSSNRTELSWLSKQFLNFYWYDLTQPINPPIHPPTHLTIHPPMGGEFFTDFKSLNRIEISWFIQVLSNFNWLQGVNPWGVGVGMSVWGMSYACMHSHTCTHTHTYMLNMINMDASMLAAICNFYTCIHVHACVCMCVGTPHMPPPAPRHPQPTCPLPRAARSPKHQISITLELIKIIQFCLKILYLWTFLNSYRL